MSVQDYAVARFDWRVRGLSFLNRFQIKSRRHASITITNNFSDTRIRCGASGHDDRLSQSQTKAVRLFTGRLHFTFDVKRLIDLRLKCDDVTRMDQKTRVGGVIQIGVE